MSSAKDKYRKIHMRMWGDKHVRALSAPQPNGQSLWVHLLAGSQTGIVPGLIASTELGMAGELRWDPEAFRKAFSEVSGEGGRKALAKADWEAGLVWVPNAIKYNPPQSPNVIVSWQQAWDELPECDLKTEAYHSLRAFVKGMGKAFQEAFDKHVASPVESSPEASPNQEQEQEQDQEQEKPQNARVARLGVEPAAETKSAEPDQTTGSAPPVSSAADFEVRTSFAAAYDVGQMPTLFGQPLRAAVAHCVNLSKRYGKPLAEVAQAVCRAAGPGTRSWNLDLSRVDPYAPVTQLRKGGRVAPSRGTTGKDFEGEPDLAEILAAKEKAKVANGA